MAKQKRDSRDGDVLNKMQSVLYQREFKRADKAYDRQKQS
ncbi:YfhE family protein [Camelliibacillus cellulosilyticus]|uniref:YfhE family protein n=1 Tax=Camelliibacillus cellulosilyticus TaxID=2174486 RepID=A0ABV9GRJ6_9BACL